MGIKRVSRRCNSANLNHLKNDGPSSEGPFLGSAKTGSYNKRIAPPIIGVITMKVFSQTTGTRLVNLAPT